MATNQSDPRKYITATRYDFPAESIEFVLEHFREILQSRSYLTMGQYCALFEEEFACYVGCRHATSVNSGTGALEIIFRSLNVEGHDVIVPTNTFAATAFAAIRAGGRLIFADCGEDMTVDPQDVKKRITPRTKVIVTVHIGGLISPHTYELVETCRDKGLHLIEDGAHAHGSMLDGKKAGQFGVAAAFSFFPTKVMTTGEGGMVVTNDDEVYHKVILLRDQAKVEGRNYHEEIGYNWRMTEVQALMGLAQLRHVERFIDRRNKIARIYDEGLAEIQGLSPLKVPKTVRHNFYKYIVFIEGYDPHMLQRRLKADYGVSLGGYVYELPCHLQPAFAEFKQGDLPVSEDLCRRHICLPIYPSLTDEEAHYMVESLKSCLS